MNRADVFRWLRTLPLRGWPAIGCGLAAVAIPTAIRAGINGALTGCEFTPYLPFVLLAAILMQWWQAAIVPMAAVAIMGGIFGGYLSLDVACFMSAAGMFLASSAVMIAVASAARQMIASSRLRNADDESGGVIFCLDKGEVWATWNGQEPPLRLGSKKKVSAMMEDFLEHSKGETDQPRYW